MQKTHHTNDTFGFARHTSRPFAKPKEPFFANEPEDSNKLEIDKLLKNVQYIAPFYAEIFTFDSLTK